MNSLFQQLNPINQQLPSNLKQIISMFKGIKNPQAMLNQMAQSNPQLKAILDASGGNYEQAFRNLAKQMNVDADEIIKLLK